MSKTISPVRPSALEHELAKTRTIEVPKTAALKPDAIAHPGATATPDLRSAAHTVAKPATSPLGPDVSGVPYASDINASAHKYGLPPTLLAGLIAEESTFRPGVVSSKGAIGLTQLEPSTAKSVGVTDPYDPAQNIAGGAKYLKGLIDAYHGNIPTALAAYNAGSGNVAKAGGVPPSYTLGYIANIDNYAKGFAHGAAVPLTTLPSTASGTATAPVETPAPVHEPASTATGSSAGLMQQGASGNAVRVLQDQLGITADGAFGPKTKAAVEQFQKAHKLEADGVVGPQTRAALAASRPELSQGATGTNVRAIQQAVGATVDGQFGPKTKAAVENFQRAHGLQADGVVGPKTWAAIEGASAATSRTRPTAPATPVKPPVTTPVSPASPTTPSGSTSAIGLKTLHIAQSQHTHEGTGNNDDDGDGKIHAYQSTTGAYNAPWCASFVSWCEQQSGGSSHRSAAVGSWVSAARQNQDNLHTTNLAHVKPGDLVAFSWDGNPNFDDGNEHIGIVQSVTANSVTFVSGNWKNSTATATLPLNDDGTKSGSKALVQFIGVGN